MYFLSDLRKLIDTRTSVPEIQNVLANILTVATENSENFYLDPNESTLVNNVIDWVIAEAHSGKDWPYSKGRNGLPTRLQGITCVEDLRMALALAEAENGGPFSLPDMPEYEELVTSFPDGAHVVRLTANEAYRREIMNMNSNIRFWGIFDNDDLENGKRSYWSIRDADGNVLAGIALNRFAICSVAGFNGVIIDEEIVNNYIRPLIEEFDLKAMEPLAVPHLVMDINGDFHDIYNLPDGITVHGNMFLYDNYPKIASLPDNMTIQGQFVINKNINLRSTPKNLVATDGIGFIKCPNLTEIGEGNSSTNNYSSFDGSPIKAVGKDCYFPEGAIINGQMRKDAPQTSLLKKISDAFRAKPSRPRRSLVEIIRQVNEDETKRITTIQDYMDDELQTRDFPGVERENTFKM